MFIVLHTAQGIHLAGHYGQINADGLILNCYRILFRVNYTATHQIINKYTKINLANKLYSKNILLTLPLTCEHFISKCSQNIQNVCFFLGYMNVKGTFHLYNLANIMKTLLIIIYIKNVRLTFNSKDGEKMFHEQRENNILRPDKLELLTILE